ncbi:hypothetical protein KSF_095790 [Reticulibacter mediterranei]|uniref:Uncharacterized protein n=1 Tax=Reticulibacter mediterranei TaxID=2778369 RepID=A0A8J3J2F2_9CHLR|nr:hypothetical protein [Reticulibacter mediterranei]GHO99531.1 hypothetical protein KSF_095790 [Reticulibacter mediterranei]
MDDKVPSKITVTRGDVLILNSKAYADLGEPAHVTVLYYKDDTQQLLILRTGGKIPVERHGNLYRLSARHVLQRFGIIVTEVTTCETMLLPRMADDGTTTWSGAALAIDISEIVSESDAFKELFFGPPPGIKDA